MSINKVSPALKRYKPGEMSRSINLSMTNTNDEEVSQKLKEDKISLSNSEKISNAPSFTKKNEIPKIEIEAQVNKGATMINSSEAKTPYIQYTIDEVCLDTCLEKLKFTMRKLNFNQVQMSNEIKEQILPETIFRKDLILLCSDSLDKANNINNKNKKNVQAGDKPKLNRKKVEENNTSKGIILTHSQNIKENALISQVSPEKIKNNSKKNKNSLLNDSSNTDIQSRMSQNKFPISQQDNKSKISNINVESTIKQIGEIHPEQMVKEIQGETPCKNYNY